MGDVRARFYSSLILLIAVMIALGVWVSCGGNSSTSLPISSGTGTVTTSLNDPPTCAAPNGPYSNVWITITKVTANLSASASPNDSGWETLVDLTKTPKQIDLLSLASTSCILTQLGSTSGLPPGNYQQIRLYLLDNSPASGTAVPTLNNCGGGGPFNCVVTNGSTQPLLLSSEAKTGIKIPPGQIAGGGINLQTGQSADINIDFDACTSIVVQGNGGYRLKPTLTAGAVSLNQNSIGGTVVDSTTKNPIPDAVVFFEQPDPNNPNIDRAVHSGVTASDGTFFFCPLPAGNYDVVVAASLPCAPIGLQPCNLASPVVYNATVTLKVPLGTNMGNVPLVRETSTLPTSSPATISGVIQATPGTSVVCIQGAGCGAVADISLSALQPVGGSSSLLVTVPLFSGSTPSVTTDSALPGSSTATSCGTFVGTGCVTYNLVVPASNPQVGTFSSSPPTTYTQPAANPAIYWVNALAFVPMSASTNPGEADCSPSSLPSTFASGPAGNSLSLNPGDTATQNFAFTGCQ